MRNLLLILTIIQQGLWPLSVFFSLKIRNVQNVLKYTNMQKYLQKYLYRNHLLNQWKWKYYEDKIHNTSTLSQHSLIYI